MQRLYKRADSPTWYVYLGKIDGKHVYKSTGCRDRRAAETRAAELEREARDPAHATANQTTVADAVARLLSDRQNAGKADGTLHMYRVKAGHILRILGDGTPLAALEGTAGARAVDSFTERRLSEGASRNTIGKELTTLRMMLKVARRRGEYRGDPAAVMPTMWSTDYKPRKRALTPDEWAKVWADFTADPKHFPGRGEGRGMHHRAAHLAFILATSANLGESFRAMRPDIDFTRKQVTIRGTKTKYRERIVPIVGPAWGMLRNVVAWHEAHGDPARPMFGPWGSVRADLRRLCERIDIPPFSPNDVRRTTATWLRNAGVEPNLIGLVLGHGDSRMVERVYGRMSPEALGAALRARLGEGER